jgi:hypothetical protein
LIVAQLPVDPFGNEPIIEWTRAMAAFSYATLPSVACEDSATGINDAEQIVGCLLINNGTHGFLYDPSTGAARASMILRSLVL